MDSSSRPNQGRSVISSQSMFAIEGFYVCGRGTCKFLDVDFIRHFSVLLEFVHVLVVYLRFPYRYRFL